MAKGVRDLSVSEQASHIFIVCMNRRSIPVRVMAGCIGYVAAGQTGGICDETLGPWRRERMSELSYWRLHVPSRGARVGDRNLDRHHTWALCYTDLARPHALPPLIVLLM